MTFKYNNVYIKDTAVVAGKFEHEGPMSKYFQDYYDDFYMNAKTWEQAESKMASETIGKITKKNKIDLIIAGDLLNQISASNFAVANFPIPYLGIYNACATATEGLIIASNFVEAVQTTQGTYIACLEEISYRQGWISAEQVLELAKPLMKTGYGKYLVDIVEEVKGKRGI